MKRISRNQLLTIADTLNSRHVTILGLVSDHRFVTSDQLARYLQPHYSTRNSAVRQTNRLTKHLESLGLIRHLNRRIGGTRPGSTSHIWHLTEAGQRLTHIDPATNQPPTVRPKRRWREPSQTFLTHTLAVTEIRIVVEETSRSTPIKLLGIETEPTCWRHHTNPYGHSETIKPDLALITRRGPHEHHWWCEADLGTENPARITSKAHNYLRHYHSGVEQQTRGVFPQIIWVTPTEARRKQLRDILSADSQLPPGMHLTATPTQLPAIITNQDQTDDNSATPKPWT